MKFWRKFRKLLRYSVITGIPQIVASRRNSRKVLKALVFVLCIVGFFYQTYYFLEVYWSFPTVVDVQTHYPDEFELPALSVCSYNGIKSTVFCNRFQHLCSSNSDIVTFCKKNPLTCDLNGDHTNGSFATLMPNELPEIPRTEFQSMGASYEDLVKECGIFTSPNVSPCSPNYRHISVFDVMGLPNNCYTLNSLWGNATTEPTVIKAKSVLFVTLTSVKSNEDHFYTGTPFAIQLSLHSPYSLINPFRDGFAINPCSNYNVYVSKQINLLLPPPYSTKCRDYWTQWRQRGGKGPLTKRLCSEECLLNQSVSTEGCVDSFYITYPNSEKICSSRVDNDKLYEKCADSCSAACREEDIDFDVQELSHIKRKGDKKKKGNECQSLILFRFNKMEVTEYRYLPKYESIELFGYIGGYLGMWLGISLVAVCDFIETVVLVIQCCWQNAIFRGITNRKLKANQRRQNACRHHLGFPKHN